MKDGLPIFRFLRDRAASGQGTVLVTLTGKQGGAARAPGAHMAVSADGSASGSFSGGCVEAAVIGEALRVLEAGVPRTVRFGAGSPLMDVRLPCGGGIDLLFEPEPDPAMVGKAVELLENRRPVCLAIAAGGRSRVREARDDDRTGRRGELFLVRHDPVLRLVVMGHGAEPASLLRLARAWGADAVLVSADENCIHDAEAMGVPVVRLRGLGAPALPPLDRRTAVVTLFHDHDREPALLLPVLEGETCFVGAMGSVRTHAERCRRLLEAGARPDQVSRIVGPIGLIPAVRDPDTLAVSILAQILAGLGSQPDSQAGEPAGMPHGATIEAACAVSPPSARASRHGMPVA